MSGEILSYPLGQTDFTLGLFHDPARPGDCTPFGPVRCGEQVCLRLRYRGALAELAEARLWLRLAGERQQRLPLTATPGGWQVTFIAPQQPQLLHYCFELEADDAASQLSQQFALSVYAADFTTPPWLSQGVLYQIFPDRFARGSEQATRAALAYHRSRGRAFRWHDSWQEEVDWAGDDYQPLDVYGGSLAAITARLDDLAELGVSVIYLNPIFEAASNHRYNTADYLRIDPLLGTEDDFRELCRAAAARGIHLLLDGVFSHTGDDSRYFDVNDSWGEGACQRPDSPYRSWYDFDGKYQHGYRCWWNFPTLPEVNENDPGWQNFIISGPDAVMKRWLRLGADGWRLDVADELPDEVLRLMRRQVKAEQADAVLLGEVWEDAVSKVSYGQPRSYALGEALDSVMNYPLRRALLDFALGYSDAYALADFLLHQRMSYPPPLYYSLMNLLSSHDVERVRSVLALGREATGLSRAQQAELLTHISDEDDRRAAQMQYLLAAIIWSLPGLPAIYYGDDLGMQGLCDPFDRRPMQEGRYPLRQEYALLSRLRRENPALTRGAAAFWAAQADLLCLLRWDGAQAVVCLVNRAATPIQAVIDLLQPCAGLDGPQQAALKQADFSQAVNLIDKNSSRIEKGLLSVNLAPCSMQLLELHD